MTLLEIEQGIRDTYEVERFLGEGAFAEVYRVRHRILGRQAMKVFRDAGMTQVEIEDVLGEAILLSRIGHPGIIRVFDANTFELGGRTFGYFTMEYVSGGDLGQYWRSYRHKLMPVAEVMEIMSQVCAGLAVAHAETPPIVHRDIKPQNILVGYDRQGLRARVSDFGLAKRVNPLTLLASARGTPKFKPPESFRNVDSCASDVWALGATMYLLLTDVLPFPGLDEREMEDDSRFLRPLRPAGVYNIRVDPALDAILARCLAPKCEERYPDAGALLADLLRWKPGDRSEAPGAETATKTDKTALGEQESPDRGAVRGAVREAMRLARDPTQLVIAADLLEEAIAKDASLRERYESQITLWRRGICM